MEAWTAEKMQLSRMPCGTPCQYMAPNTKHLKPQSWEKGWLVAGGAEDRQYAAIE